MKVASGSTEIKSDVSETNEYIFRCRNAKWKFDVQRTAVKRKYWNKEVPRWQSESRARLTIYAQYLFFFSRSERVLSVSRNLGETARFSCVPIRRAARHSARFASYRCTHRSKGESVEFAVMYRTRATVSHN